MNKFIINIMTYNNGLGNTFHDTRTTIAYDCHMEKLPIRASDLVSKHFRTVDTQKKALERLGILTIENLLYHFPVRHVDAGKSSPIELAEDGERVSVYGQIEKTGTKKSFRSRVPMGEATLRDQTGKMKLVWFNQAYMAKMIVSGDYVRASGTVSKRSNTVSLVNPEIEKLQSLPADITPSLFHGEGHGLEEQFFPVYPESKGITSRWFFYFRLCCRFCGKSEIANPRGLVWGPES